MLTGRNGAELGPADSNTLRRNRASVIKDLILIFNGLGFETRSQNIPALRDAVLS